MATRNVQIYSTRRQGYLLAGHRITSLPIRFLVVDAPIDESSGDRKARHRGRKLTEQELKRLEEMRDRTPEGKHPPVEILKHDVGPEVEELDNVRAELKLAHEALAGARRDLGTVQAEVVAMKGARKAAEIDLAKVTDHKRALDAAIDAAENSLG